MWSDFPRMLLGFPKRGPAFQKNENICFSGHQVTYSGNWVTYFGNLVIFFGNQVTFFWETRPQFWETRAQFWNLQWRQTKVLKTCCLIVIYVRKRDKRIHVRYISRFGVRGPSGFYCFWKSSLIDSIFHRVSELGQHNFTFLWIDSSDQAKIDFSWSQ